MKQNIHNVICHAHTRMVYINIAMPITYLKRHATLPKLIPRTIDGKKTQKRKSVTSSP